MTTTSNFDDIDPIAVERCLAGTLRAQRLTPAERDHVVTRLYQLGYSNPEIVQRTRIAITDIKSTLTRLGLVPHKNYRLTLRAPQGCTPDQARRARRLVAAMSHGAEDARNLLLALGLIDRLPIWTVSARKSTGRKPLATDSSSD